MMSHMPEKMRPKTYGIPNYSLCIWPPTDVEAVVISGFKCNSQIPSSYAAEKRNVEYVLAKLVIDPSDGLISHSLEWNGYLATE
jgi:hypothetical protein